MENHHSQILDSYPESAVGTAPVRMRGLSEGVRGRKIDCRRKVASRSSLGRHAEGNLCEAEFRPNPDHLGEMSNMFAAHVRLSHPDDKTIREDVNQAAARIVRKTTGG